jgi:hypothetical protein
MPPLRMVVRWPRPAGGDEDREDQADEGDHEHDGESDAEGPFFRQVHDDQDRADQGGAQRGPRLETRSVPNEQDHIKWAL